MSNKTEITTDGLLKDAVKDSHMFPGKTVIRGHVHGDRKRRFDDGEWIRTSAIIREIEEDGYSVVITRNSIYKVEYKKNEIFHHPV